MQSVGGAMIFVTLDRLVELLGLLARRSPAGGATAATPARLQISSAMRGETRENSPVRQPVRLRALVSRSICISTPSSTPYGCGLISAVAGGSSFVTRGSSTSSPVPSAFGGR